jgi:hypothetical protein
MKANGGTIKEQNDAIKAELSVEQTKGSTETEPNDLADQLLATQSLPKENKDLAMAPNTKASNALQSDEVEIPRKSDKNIVAKSEDVDPEETESEEDDPPLKLPPISPQQPFFVLQKKKAPKYGYPRDNAPNPIQSLIPSAPAPPAMGSQSQVFLTPQVKFHLEQLRAQGRAQDRAQSQLDDQIRAHERAHSQLEQLQAHDRMQLEQLRAAQEARRNHVLLSHGIDPCSFAGPATLVPSSTAAILQTMPASSAISTTASSAVEKARKPLTGIELLSDVADVMMKDPPAKAPAPLSTPANLRSSQDPAARVGLGLSVPSRQDTLGILGVLQNAIQHQNNVRKFESTLAFAQMMGGLDPRYRDQLVAAGYETAEMKRRRLGGYPFP